MDWKHNFTTFDNISECSRCKSHQLRPEYTSTAGAIASVVQEVAKTVPKSLDRTEPAEDVLTIRWLILSTLRLNNVEFYKKNRFL